MKSVILTGATSMLGIATIKKCIDNGVKVIAISRKNSKKWSLLPKSSLIDEINCDLSELKDLDLERDDIDVFYHFGWGFTDSSTRNDLNLQRSNIEYTLDAVDLAYRLGCKRFIGAGSQAEYGFHDYEIFENTTCEPQIAYGKAKLDAYRQASDKCKSLGMEFVWTRTFSVYGTNDNAGVLVKYVVKKYKEKSVAELSSGKQMWNYLFEDDAGEYFYRLGDRPSKCFSNGNNNQEILNTIVNIGNIKSKKMKEYFDDIIDTIGEGFEYHLDTLNDKKLNGIQPNVNYLIDITQYYPQTEFKDGFKRVFSYTMNNS